jgi:hypothetical protein
MVKDLLVAVFASFLVMMAISWWPIVNSVMDSKENTVFFLLL